MKTFPLPWPNSSYDCGRSLSSGKTPLADAMVRAHDEGSKSRQSISCDLCGVASGSAVAREYRAAGCRRACGLVISDGELWLGEQFVRRQRIVRLVAIRLVESAVGNDRSASDSREPDAVREPRQRCRRGGYRGRAGRLDGA